MSESITIKLAGKDYTIGALTVGQLEELHVGVLEAPDADPQAGARKFWKRNLDLIAIALSADHPDVTRDVIGKMRLGSIKAVNQTVTEILKFAGLVDDEKKDIPAGESRAAAE
ncbi:MAG TPA: hypothetical protein VFB54_17740 [Burkholderiales bacterium]|nr:hypothetical protein [Burkholderiales bacterium]